MKIVLGFIFASVIAFSSFSYSQLQQGNINGDNMIIQNASRDTSYGRAHDSTWDEQSRSWHHHNYERHGGDRDHHSDNKHGKNEVKMILDRDPECKFYMQLVPVGHQHWHKCSDGACKFFNQYVPPGHQHWHKDSDIRCTYFNQYVPPGHQHVYR